MSQILHDTDKMMATYDGLCISIRIKASGKSVTVGIDGTPQAVTSKPYLDALCKQGVAPGTKRMLGPLCMDTADAEAIVAAVRSLPEVQAKLLHSEREALARRVSAILDETGYQRERAFETESLVRLPDYDSPAYRAARAALEAFDVAHPEIIAAIRAARKANVERHMWD